MLYKILVETKVAASQLEISNADGTANKLVTVSLNRLVDVIGLSLAVDGMMHEEFALLEADCKSTGLTINSGDIVEACSVRGIKCYDSVTKKTFVFDAKKAKAAAAASVQNAQKRAYDCIKQKVSRLNKAAKSKTGKAATAAEREKARLSY